MVNAINAALSGLHAASKRIAVSAQNIVNQNSTKTVENGQVVNTPYVAQRVDQVSLSGGGVLVQTRDVNPPSATLFDPDNPDADVTGAIQVPNVRLEDEAINQKIAVYNYKASLSVLKAQDKLDKSLLDIFS